MIIYDKGEHKKLIYDMWEENFHDPIPYADFYFDNVYRKNQVLLLKEENAIKGMLHWNPYNMKVKGQEISANYIVGVATQEEYRRQGVMKKLLVETFLRLREEGQAFTYLMPANKDYYLPFDFRFGMKQIDQELEVRHSKIKEQDAWEFADQIQPEEKERISQKENEIRDKTYDIHTRITKDYLSQLEKEAKSDFARILYVYSNRPSCEDKCYMGRFVVGTEDSYMSISQVSCVRSEQKKEFLNQILSYCENRYHYGRYRLVLDVSWMSVLEEFKNEKNYRILPQKETPIIMFRILDLAKMGNMISGKKEQTVKIKVKDQWLPEQEGIYLWKITPQGSEISLRNDNGETSDAEDVPNAGEISIGDLTNYLFGNIENKKIEENSTLTEEGKQWIKNLIPIKKVCILEIV